MVILAGDVVETRRDAGRWAVLGPVDNLRRSGQAGMAATWR